MAALDVTLPLAPGNAEAAAAALCLQVLRRPACSVQRMRSGITNVVLLLQLEGQAPPQRLLIRLYGRNTEAIIDRAAELANHRKMQAHGLAPPIYAVFGNGYIYGYLEGTPTAPLELQDPAVFPLVARRVADVHRLPLPEGGRPAPTVFASLRRYHRQASETMSRSPKNPQFQAALDWGQVGLDVEALAAAVEALVPLSTVVYCHNDLLAGNVIVRPDRAQVDFIDFEYASPNYQAYDIGNHFNEQCGLDVVDYALYPAKALQQQWLRTYLAAYHGTAADAIPARDVEALFHETELMALASHLFWGIWAMIQAACATIDFDYFGYGLIRLAEFRRRHQPVVAAARQFFQASSSDMPQS